MEAGWQRAPLARVGEVLAASLVLERDRWVLWLPVLFAAGIGIYFALPVEPSPWLAPAVTVGALTLAVVGRHRPVILLLTVGAASVGCGAVAAQWRTVSVAAPVLERRWGPAEFEGRVRAVEIRPEGRRIILDRLALPGLEPARTPASVRVRVRGAVELIPGERVALRAVLMPPPGPAAPGAYDFQRQAWFDRLGGVGYSLGAIRRLGPADSSASAMTLWLNATRQDVVERVLAVLPGPAGAVAAALLTGEQGAVSPEVMGWMRDSGLAHLLSVSGLHVGLVAMIVFFFVRRSLALVPALVLRYPVKKWAAVAAFVAITAYMLFVAPGVPTQRSWLMSSIVLFAIVIDRTAISMRLVAWAAFAVLAIAPDSLLGPSFQMSFAAVVALIAAWETIRVRFSAWRAQAGLLRRMMLGLVGASMTTLVAGLATAPYALYHFNRFTAYGLAANILAVPLTSFWVMPWAVATFLLLPFGLESWALVPMGWGADGILAIARAVAGWGGAVALLPEMPVWGLVIATLGGLWLCLWQTPWRLWGVPVIMLGLASIALHRGPDILVSGDARLLAVRGADGLLQLSSNRLARLTRETWLRRAGQEEATASWPRAGRSADGLLSCDPLGCIYSGAGHVSALVREAAALAEDCQHADLIVATVPVRRRCPSAQVVIDRFSLWRNGGHAVWLESDGVIRVESVRDARGERPWVPPRPTPHSRKAADRSEDE